MRLRLNRSLSRRDALKGMSAAAVFAATSSWPRAASAIAAPPGDEWPDFRNGQELRGIAGTQLPATPEVKWELETADGCISTPAIGTGRAYVGTLSGDLLCLNLDDGKEVWNYRSLVTNDPKTFVPGFNSPVKLTEKSVICGDDDGTLHCVDRETGVKQWTFDAGGVIVGGASVVGELVVFGSHSQFLYGLNLQTGMKQWEFDCQGPVNGTQVMAGQFTFVTGCSEPVLYVVDTTTGKEHSRLPLDDLLIASPAILGDVLYFGTSEGKVLALDWRQQKALWKYELQQSQEVHSSPAVTDDLVIIGGRDKGVHALDRRSGEKRWIFPTRGSNDNSPVVAGDRVYFGSKDRNVYAVNLADGQEAWKYNAGQPFEESSPAIAAGRMVLAGSGPGGRILCFG